MFAKLFDFGIKLFLVFFPVAPADTGKIAENLYAVKTGTVDFFVYKSGKDVICFDAGFGNHLILNGLKEIGVAPEEITYLFLTHTDLDHVGGVKLFPNAKIYLSKDEEPMITGRTTRKLFIRNPRLRKPYHLLDDNEIVTVGGLKIQVLLTPGHTPGSVCYLVNDELLFTGDTLKLIDGKVRAIRRFNMDTETQIRSIQKLAAADLPVKLAITAHRGYTEHFAEAIREFRR